MPLFPDDPRLELMPSVWGPGIFENDAAIRVRNCYLERILEGRNDDATRMTLEERRRDAYGSLTDVLAWTALASVQLHIGRLDDEIRDGTIQIIEAGDCGLLAEHPEWREERERILSELAQRLKYGALAARMDDAAVRAYCRELWGDEWDRHVDPDRPEQPNYRT